MKKQAKYTKLTKSRSEVEIDHVIWCKATIDLYIQTLN